MNDKQFLLNHIIVRHLMLYAHFSGSSGLLSGKMGICIFFYKYARHTGKKLYDDFARELLDEIYDDINSVTRTDFADGFSGICWGMEYIIRNGYVDADADNILEDLDLSILGKDVRRITNTSIESGLEGLAHYVLARCSNKPKLPLDSQYITELKCNMERRECNPELVIKLDYLLKGKEYDYTFDLIDIIAAGCVYKQKNSFKEPNLGISRNGLAGIALRLVNESER